MRAFVTYVKKKTTFLSAGAPTSSLTSTPPGPVSAAFVAGAIEDRHSSPKLLNLPSISTRPLPCIPPLVERWQHLNFDPDDLDFSRFSFTHSDFGPMLHRPGECIASGIGLTPTGVRAATERRYGRFLLLHMKDSWGTCRVSRASPNRPPCSIGSLAIFVLLT
jgi:hypothetical protein